MPMNAKIKANMLKLIFPPRSENNCWYMGRLSIVNSLGRPNFIKTGMYLNNIKIRVIAKVM